MATQAYIDAARSATSDPHIIVKLELDSGDKYFSESKRVATDWPLILPRLLSFSPVSNDIDVDKTKRVSTTNQITIKVSDYDNALKDALLANPARNRAVKVYLTFAGLTEAESKQEFDGLINEWSGLEEVSISARNRLDFSQAEVNPEQAVFQVRSIRKASSPATPDSNIHPVTLRAEETISSEKRAVKLTLTTGGTTHELTYDDTETFSSFVSDIEALGGGGYYEVELFVSDTLKPVDLFKKTYNLSTLTDGVYDYAWSVATGFEKIYEAADPFSQMLAVLDDIGYPLANIDTASFIAARDYRPKWVFRRHLKKSTKARDLLVELAISVNGFIADKEGLLTMVLFRPLHPDDDLIELDSSMLKPGSTINVNSNFSDLVNKVTIRYNWNGSSFDASRTIEDTESQADHGETRAVKIDSKWIADEATGYTYKIVEALAQRVLSWQSESVLLVSCKTSLAAAYANVGDYVLFTSSRVSTTGFSSRRFLVLSKVMQGNTVSFKLADVTRLKGVFFGPADLLPYDQESDFNRERYYFFSENDTFPAIMPDGTEGSHWH